MHAELIFSCNKNKGVICGGKFVCVYHFKDFIPGTLKVMGVSWQKHIFKDVEAVTKYAFPSDDYPLIATIWVRAIRNKEKT